MMYANVQLPSSIWPVCAKQDSWTKFRVHQPSVFSYCKWLQATKSRAWEQGSVQRQNVRVAKFLQHCNAKSTLHNLVPFFPSSFQPTKTFISLTTQLCLLLPLVKHFITSVSSASLQQPCLSWISTSALNLHWMPQLLWGKLWGFMTHSLVSFQCSWLSDQKMLLLTKKLFTVTEMMPFKGRGDFNTPVCTNNMRSGPASADQTWSTAS